MRELTQPEFQDRLLAIQRAMHIFGELTSNHMTKAFTAYQEIFAEREREIFMTQASGGDPRQTMQQVRRYEIVPCPECTREMFYRPLEDNPEGFKLQWVCSNPDCDTVLNSENDITWWMNKLRKRRPHGPRSQRTISKLEKRQQEG
jgi:hypothetical protein